MSRRRNINICKICALIFAYILALANMAYSADCFVGLTKAENRWIALRDAKPLATNVKMRLTEQLTLAAELRHQGRGQDCVLQVNKAMKAMDALEARH